ncbi:MAG: hypothetical protein ACI9JL_001420 [Paracoccaceae bacterium]|jgi:hypothetical protein
MIFKTMLRTSAFALVAMLIAILPARAMPFHDVYLMLDNSGSLGSVDFDAQKQAAINVINDYGGQANNPMRFSIIEFATDATIVHSLGDSQDTSDVLASLNALSYTGGWTDTPEAIQLMLGEFDTFGNAGNVATAILFTDGQPRDISGELDVCQYEPQIKSRNISTKVVGHGDGWVAENGAQKVGCLVNDVGDILSRPAPLEYDIADYEYLSATTIVAMAEPGSLAVLGLGLVAIGFARRRAA